MYDLNAGNSCGLPVSFYTAELSPNRSKTRRWNWHSVLGSRNNKAYEYLVLIGEKDPQHEEQYPADLDPVFFLVPRSDVDDIKTGNDIAINTNLAKVRVERSLALQRHLVTAGDMFTSLLGNVEVR
jgi:hypothetical protein